MPIADPLERRWSQQRYRARLRAERGLAPAKPRKPSLRPFMGVDGEGWGVNRKGQQHYMLLRAGPHELYTGKPLTTLQCLDFLCDLPGEPILVGFSFGYDATQMLREGLPPERWHRLFEDKPMGEGLSRYTYFEDFGIEYLPRNYLRVCRVQRVRVRLSDGRVVRIPRRVEGTTRTIWEVFGFFQQSFLKSLQAFDVGREHWAQIERNKNLRGDFTRRMQRQIRQYCALECELLADMMGRFREICHDSGIRPRSWSGAGKIAAYLHREYSTVTAKEIADWVPSDVLDYANRAYYGGRFEITRTGGRMAKVWEYDLKSAYPSAMRELPCLRHGTWERVPVLWLRNAPIGALFVADIRFTHPEGTPLCGIPVRRKSRLLWPRQGGGTYWSVEIRSAERLGAQVEYLAGWRYVANCTCKPFDFVQPLFERRKQLGPLQGYPIKLGLNSLYGKLAQRIGAPIYGNMVWAGLITAITRARLNDAIAEKPDAIVMIATDAILSLQPLSLEQGDGLGQWEATEHPWLFVCQPGLYWSEKKPKTRGVPVSQFHKHTRRFERAWAKWCEKTWPFPLAVQRDGDWLGLVTPKGRKSLRIPVVSVTLDLFTGLKLAHARGKPATAGSWTRAPKQFSFDWAMKRQAFPVAWETPQVVRTLPHDGSPDLISEPHDGSVDRSNVFDLDRAELEDQPDHMDLSPP